VEGVGEHGSYHGMGIQLAGCCDLRVGRMDTIAAMTPSVSGSIQQPVRSNSMMVSLA
jgi:hypothetical protein